MAGDLGGPNVDLAGGLTEEKCRDPPGPPTEMTRRGKRVKKSMERKVRIVRAR